nr:YrdB family protein [Actinopolymorpha rutila]
MAAVFALELCALGALGYVASRGASPLAVRIALGVGVPLVAAVLWGLFAAPNATFHNPAAMVTVKVLVFGAAAVGLFLTGHRTLGVAFAVTVVLTAVLAQVLPSPDATNSGPAAGVSHAADTRP